MISLKTFYDPLRLPFECFGFGFTWIYVVFSSASISMSFSTMDTSVGRDFAELMLCTDIAEWRLPIRERSSKDVESPEGLELELLDDLDSELRFLGGAGTPEKGRCLTTAVLKSI